MFVFARTLVLKFLEAHSPGKYHRVHWKFIGPKMGVEKVNGKDESRSEKCFVELDPKRLPNDGAMAASLVGACKYGRLVSPREMRPIDLVVCGAVAVTRDGARIGKGGGYADLEYALLREEGKIRESTPILTTVHAIQIVRNRVPMLPHDVPVDFIVTPTQVVATRLAHQRPRGIYWDLLRPPRIDRIPLLRKRLHSRVATPSPRTL